MTDEERQELRRASVKRYQDKNRELIREKAKQRYQKEKNDPVALEKLRERGRAFYHANKEERDKKTKAYHEKNKEYYKEYRRAWVAKNRDYLNARARGCPKKRYRGRTYDLRKKYNLSREQLDSMIAECEGRCPCCKTIFGTLRESRPSVDHSHLTGKVRGVLCWRCNILIGHANDQPAILRACARYLKRFTSNDAEEA
jgi:hypothetical protein